MFPFVLKNRVAANDAQIRQSAQIVDNAFGQAVGKIFGVGVLIFKRQNGDGFDLILRLQWSAKISKAEITDAEKGR